MRRSLVVVVMALVLVPALPETPGSVLAAQEGVAAPVEGHLLDPLTPFCGRACQAQGDAFGTARLVSAVTEAEAFPLRSGETNGWVIMTTATLVSTGAGVLVGSIGQNAFGIRRGPVVISAAALGALLGAGYCISQGCSW
jgi:hypothetical protein